MTKRKKDAPAPEQAAEAKTAPDTKKGDDRPSATERRAEKDAVEIPAQEGAAEPPEGEGAAEPREEEDPAANIADLEGRLLRALAETENVRRRAAKEREDVSKYAIAALARDMLPVIDNLRRAIDSVSDEVRKDEGLSGVVDGIELTERELLSVLDRHGIRRIDPLGEKFDHNYHQAIFEVEDSDEPAGTVVQVVQAGYVLANRLLRAAMVGVAKGSKPPPRVDTEA